MSKKRQANGERGKGKSARKSGGGWLRRIIFWFIACAIIIVLFAVFWPVIVDWANNVAYGTIEVMGWGLILVVLAIAILAGFIWRCGLSWLFWRGYRWLGAIAFIAAIWGIFSFIPGGIGEGNQGGNIGLVIIGAQNWIGALRVLGLLIVGVLLVAPRASSRQIARFVSWLWGLMQIKLAERRVRKAVVSPTAYQPSARPKPAKAGAKPEPPAFEPEISKKAAPALASGGETPKDLKQVAQEVWKKYGESSSSTTVDGWRLPSVEILDVAPETEFSQADNAQRARLIEDALASYGVEVKVVQINAGPTVTQFGIEPGAW